MKVSDRGEEGPIAMGKKRGRRLREIGRAVRSALEVAARETSREWWGCTRCGGTAAIQAVAEICICTSPKTFCLLHT
jgi:hypothetical protein